MGNNRAGFPALAIIKHRKRAFLLTFKTLYPLSETRAAPVPSYGKPLNTGILGYWETAGPQSGPVNLEYSKYCAIFWSRSVRQPFAKITIVTSVTYNASNLNRLFISWSHESHVNSFAQLHCFNFVGAKIETGLGETLRRLSNSSAFTFILISYTCN